MAFTPHSALHIPHYSVLLRRFCGSVVWMVGLLVLMPFGCMTTKRQLAFLGGQLQPQPSEQVASSTPHSEPSVFMTAKGWLVSRPQGESLSVDITNRGVSPIRLSYASDDYTGQTRDGRSVTLEKAGFLSYPDFIQPGETKTVMLAAPKEAPFADVERIVAQFGIDHITLPLSSAQQPVLAGIDPTLRAQTPPEGGIRIPDSQASTMASALSPVEATVPVEMEFQQELGATLKLQVRWNDLPQTVTMTSSEQQMFYVAPGRHSIAVMAQMPPLGKTQGLVPLIVSPGEPLRVTVDGRATLTGVSLRVRVWTRQKLLFDQTFGPSTSR